MNTALFNKEVNDFILFANKNKVQMLLVGGGAVNFYGYQRHSSDVDFWISISEDNLMRLKNTLIDIGFEIDSFPQDVLNGAQNISIKISPISEIELITNFNPGCSFDEAYLRRKEIINENLVYPIISLKDLIDSKIKSQRPKDLLDVYELKRIHRID